MPSMDAVALPQWYQVESWIITWAPIIFMGLLVFFIWRTLKLMPRTKPQQIEPESSSSIGWAEVAGADEAKAELAEVVEFLRDPARFHALGAKVPKGILLHGPPGTGKTLLAKAVASESGATFYSQSASSFVEMFAGLGAARIRRLFDEARKNEPAILFIDELDAVGAQRGSDNNSEREQTLNQLLVEMDGFSSSGRLVVMAASNLLEKLDPALLRPGRFDRQVFVSPPDVEGRRAILEVHTQGKPTRDVAGVESSRRLTDHERRVVAWHEAGHALCGELLPNVDKPHKVSIVPRGSALGFAMSLPEEDRYLKTREDLIDYMAVCLGGRVAEQLVFGAVTTGAANDLQKVAEITDAMVNQYAMGDAANGQRAWVDIESAS